MKERYGKKKADQLMGMMLKHYKRLVYINMDKEKDCECHRAYARSKAAAFELKYEEMSGSSELFDDLIKGYQNDQLQYVEPGQALSYNMFFKETEKV